MVAAAGGTLVTVQSSLSLQSAYMTSPLLKLAAAAHPVVTPETTAIEICCDDLWRIHHLNHFVWQNSSSKLSSILNRMMKVWRLDSSSLFTEQRKSGVTVASRSWVLMFCIRTQLRTRWLSEIALEVQNLKVVLIVLNIEFRPSAYSRHSGTWGLNWPLSLDRNRTKEFRKNII